MKLSYYDFDYMLDSFFFCSLLCLTERSVSLLRYFFDTRNVVCNPYFPHFSFETVPPIWIEIEKVVLLLFYIPTISHLFFFGIVCTLENLWIIDKFAWNQQISTAQIHPNCKAIFFPASIITFFCIALHNVIHTYDPKFWMSKILPNFTCQICSNNFFFHNRKMPFFINSKFSHIKTFVVWHH